MRASRDQHAWDQATPTIHWTERTTPLTRPVTTAGRVLWGGDRQRGDDRLARADPAPSRQSQDLLEDLHQAGCARHQAGDSLLAQGAGMNPVPDVMLRQQALRA